MPSVKIFPVWALAIEELLLLVGLWYYWSLLGSYFGDRIDGLAKRCANFVEVVFGRDVLYATEASEDKDVCFGRPLRSIPLFVVSCALDEARAWLRVVSLVSELPYLTVWILNWPFLYWRVVAGIIYGLLLICAMFLFHLSLILSLVGDFFLAPLLFGLIAIACAFAQLVSAAVEIIFSQILQSRMWGFGPENIWCDLGLSIKVSKTPHRGWIKGIELHELKISRILRERGWRALWDERNSWNPLIRYSFFHGLMCNDPPTIAKIADWIASQSAR